VLPIYVLIGMAASTPRHCFGQFVEVYTSCMFNTVTPCSIHQISTYLGYMEHGVSTASSRENLNTYRGN
jgi:hypothetical protein